MRISKSYLVIPILVGGLWFSAAMLSSKVYALSDSSADPTVSSPTVTPTTSASSNTSSSDTTSTPLDTDSTPTPAATNTSPISDTINDTTPTITDSSISTPDNSDSSTPATTTTPSSTNGATVDNTIQSGATSGDATVSNNTQAGDATSGSASATATLVNTIQSASAATSDPNGFEVSSSAVNGTDNGDMYVDPSQLSDQGSPIYQIYPEGGSSSNSGTIDNTVDLAATSGDATVEDNGTAGNATTGSADAEAQIINLINSSISDNQGWIDTIDINGTLNGNIVLPADVLDALLDPMSANGTAAVEASANNVTNVTNSVSLLASSGTATVSNNGTAGSATTGNANTNLDNYSLVNNDIVGGNMLLVFVNVAGNWVGLLLDAPAGTTTAALGGGIQQDSIIPVAQTTDNSNVETVVNNVNLQAITGNALVTYNGQAGNATSGNAASSATIVNLLGDQIALSGWLGVLVINVFGSWNGSLVLMPSVTNSAVADISSTPITLLNSVGNTLTTSSFHKKFIGRCNTSVHPNATTAVITSGSNGSGASQALKHSAVASLAPTGIKLIHKGSNTIGEVALVIGIIISVVGVGAMSISKKLARQ